jgi:hypothetical protein
MDGVTQAFIGALTAAIASLTGTVVYLWKKTEEWHGDTKRELKDLNKIANECIEDRSYLRGKVELMEKVLEHQFVGDRSGCLNDLFEHPPKDETKH